MGLAAASGLDFMRQVLELRGYRQQILAADIANASTPGFKGVDLDFRQALASAAGDVADGSTPAPSRMFWLVDDPRHLSGPLDGAAAGRTAASAIKYQADSPVTLDGNSVDLNREKVAAADNAVQYEAATTFASQILRMLTTAIGGSAAAAGGGG